MKNKNVNERLEGLAYSGLGLVIGGVYGTIDISTTGLPIVSGFLEVPVLSQLENCFKDLPSNKKKKIIASQIGYFVGVSIPFGIKYQNEIYSFVEGVLK